MKEKIKYGNIEWDEIIFLEGNKVKLVKGDTSTTISVAMLNKIKKDLKK